MTEKSTKLWLENASELNIAPFILGPHISFDIRSDPKRLLFLLSRYKFVSKILSENFKNVLEIGCGDGFGAPVVAQSVDMLTCVDIDPLQIKDNQMRLADFKNIEFIKHDFISSEIPNILFDACFMLDVLEHIYPEEENIFIDNIIKNLEAEAVCIVGVPNKDAEKYASERSRLGHVNLKTQEDGALFLKKKFRFVFNFSMNDEVIHTGFTRMSNYNFHVCINPLR
jgi:2-polyprenyl-3-methyl-5-hydroxy-6-metoxy-1,4-benzoquinol methylase